MSPLQTNLSQADGLLISLRPLCLGLQQQERYWRIIAPACSVASGRLHEQSLVLIDMDGAWKGMAAACAYPALAHVSLCMAWPPSHSTAGEGRPFCGIVRKEQLIQQQKYRHH